MEGMFLPLKEGVLLIGGSIFYGILVGKSTDFKAKGSSTILLENLRFGDESSDSLNCLGGDENVQNYEVGDCEVALK